MSVKTNTCVKYLLGMLNDSKLNFICCINCVPLVLLNFDYDVCCVLVITLFVVLLAGDHLAPLTLQTGNLLFCSMLVC